MPIFKGNVFFGERLLVLGTAIAVSWAYFYELQKTAKMSGDFGPGTIVVGAAIALVCNVGLFLTQTKLVEKSRVFVAFSLLPSLLISPIVIWGDDFVAPIVFVIFVGFLMARLFGSPGVKVDRAIQSQR